METMAQTIRGMESRGFGFPISKGREGYWPRRNSAARRQTEIAMILGTTPGERVGEPTFGSLLPSLVFEPNDLITVQKARQYTINALAQWAPMIEVVNVTIERRDDGLAIFIDYIDLGAERREPRTFVYPVRRG